jgi:DedD protein
MAFFKFRFPGQAEQSATSTDAVPAGAGENIDVVRRRARHRLMGAVVLVLGAVIVFPVLFDTQPRPVAVNTPIVIPDRQIAQPLFAAGTLPPAQRPAVPLLPAPSALPASAGLDADEQAVTGTKPSPHPVAPKTATPATSEVPKPVAKPAALVSPSPRPADKPVPVKSPKTEPASKAKDDGSKAKSLLDAKPATSAGRHIIQVGAFADTAKVREVRQKLQQAGVTTYTQVIEANDGKTTTRVRVGPFDSREEAEKMADRVRKLGLSPALLKL